MHHTILKKSLEQVMKKEQDEFVLPPRTYRGGSQTPCDLIYFKASWCPNCTQFSRSWNAIKKSDLQNISYEEYDVDEHKDMASKYRINHIPALRLKVGNKRAVAYDDDEMKKDKIIRWIEKNR